MYVVTACELPEDRWSEPLGLCQVCFKLDSTGYHGSEPCTVGIWVRFVVACRYIIEVIWVGCQQLTPLPRSSSSLLSKFVSSSAWLRLSKKVQTDRHCRDI